MTPRSHLCPFPLSLAVVLSFLIVPHVASEEKTEEKDDPRQALVLGIWEDDYQGRRTMTLRDDGTAVMVVELKGLKAALFASRLRFDMIWSLKDDQMHHQTVGGEPSARVNMILRTMGDRITYKLESVDEKSLVLLDPDGKTRYHWRRVVPPEKETD